MAGDSYISFAISLALSFRAKREICFVSREKTRGTAIHGKPDIPSMCVMELVLTIKTAGRKNFGALSSRGFCTMRGSVCRPSQEWGDRGLAHRFRTSLFLIGGAAAIISDPPSPHSGQQKTSGECLLPLLKCRRDTESAPVPSNAASCERPGCRRCSASQGAGKRGKHGFPGYFLFVLPFQS